MEIKERLLEIETNLPIYNKATTDPSVSESDKKVIAFKVFYEMMAFSALKEFAPDYIPSQETEIQVAKGLKNTIDLVSVINGKVIVSPRYAEILSQRQNFLNKQDGKNN